MSSALFKGSDPLIKATDSPHDRVKAFVDHPGFVRCGVAGIRLLLENISRLVGHTNTTVTETVYRKQIRPVMQEGARAMNDIFPAESEP